MMRKIKDGPSVLRGCLVGILAWSCLGGGRPPVCAEQAAPAPAAAAFPLQARRIVFLGDSNTHAGYYITWMEAQLRAARIEPRPELINLGLPSETCSGLSEPDHPFPRPDVHERLDRVLQQTQPDVVVVCYGMNDGIYYPFSDDRLAAYQAGIRRLVKKAKSAGAKVILLTPPAFDPQPMRREGKLRGIDAQRYAWFAAYEDYDLVMQRYARWILQQQDQVDMVIDIHTPLNDLLRIKRQADPDYTMSSDGVHFNQEGHVAVAREILKAWGLTSRDDVPDAVLRLVQPRQQVLHDAWLSHVGHQRPGVPAGLPLKEAQARAAEIDADLQQLAGS